MQAYIIGFAILFVIALYLKLNTPPKRVKPGYYRVIFK